METSKSRIDTEKLPQENFKEKEHYQHPQPQDQGKALEKASKEKRENEPTGNEQLRSSKSEGLNEDRSAGDAGAFEGFEDQSKDR